MLTILIAALLEAAAPSPEALALGKRLAATGGLVSMLPMVIEKDISELAGEDKTLTDAEREKLVAIGRAHGAEGREKLIAAIGQGYAAKLSIADLKTLVAQNESPAAAHWRAAEPAVIMQAMQSLGGIDLKKETAALFCKESGKLCNRK